MYKDKLNVSANCVLNEVYNPRFISKFNACFLDVEPLTITQWRTANYRPPVNMFGNRRHDFVSFGSHTCMVISTKCIVFRLKCNLSCVSK